MVKVFGPGSKVPSEGLPVGLTPVEALKNHGLEQRPLIPLGRPVRKILDVAIEITKYSPLPKILEAMLPSSVFIDAERALEATQEIRLKYGSEEAIATIRSEVVMLGESGLKFTHNHGLALGLDQYDEDDFPVFAPIRRDEDAPIETFEGKTGELTCTYDDRQGDITVEVDEPSSAWPATERLGQILAYSYFAKRRS